MMYSFDDMMLCAAVAVNIAVSVCIGAIRWGHKCEPYARHADYYYPAWKTVVVCYLSDLLMCPIVFMPTDTDAVLFLRMMLILASPLFCAALLFGYFGKVLKVGWWRNPVIALFIPFSIIAITAFVLTIMPGTQIKDRFCYWFFSISGVLAIIYLGCFVVAVIMVARAIRRFQEENYSNPDDFPRQFAKGIIWLPILHLVVSWTTTYIGSKTALSVGVLLLSVIGLIFLIGALAPHRTMDVERIESGKIYIEAVPDLPEPQISEPKPEPVVEETLSQDRKDDIAAIIRRHVEQEQAYLDSHLTLASLSRACGVNRTYLSQVINERMGGFYVYINRCRLAHVARLKVQHPEASIEEIVTASGFGSRQSYYNVRRQLE